MHIHLGVEGLLPWSLYAAMWASFFASALWKPSLGLYVLAFALPMQTGRYKLHAFFLGSELVDILILGAALGVIYKGFPLLEKLSVNRILLGTSLFLYLSLWQGAFFTSAPLPLWITDPRFSNWKNYVEMFLLALVVISAIRTKHQMQIMILIMCLGTLVVNRSYYSLLADRDLSQFSYDVRDSGLLGYAGVNGFAAFEAMLLSFLIGFLPAIRQWYLKVGAMTVLVSGLYCLLFAFSRGAYLGILSGMLTVGVVKRRKYLLFVALIVLTWQTVMPTSVQQRIMMTTSGSGSGHFDSSSEERLTLWRDALDMFKRNPVTGTGFNTYEYMHRVGPYQDTHNYYLKTLAETGLLGMGIFLILLKTLLSAGWNLQKSTGDPFYSALGVGFTAAVICAIVINFFGDRWSYQQVDGYLWILFGLVVRSLLNIREAEPREESPCSLDLQQEQMVIA